MGPITLTHAGSPCGTRGPLVPRAVLPAGQPTAPANTMAIVNNSGTVVSHTGDGVYHVSKTGGSTGAWDADAVSVSPITGDFVIRVSSSDVSGAVQVGINADPLTNSADTSVDFSWGIFPGITDYVLQNGSPLTSIPITLGICHWLWRIGSTLYWGRGATFATAFASPDWSTTYTADPVYFDSTLLNSGNSFDARFYVSQDMIGSAALAFAGSGAETAAGSLAGTSPLFFDTPTEQLRGTIPAVGSSAVTFTPTAAETAKGTLAGSTSGLFTGSAGESAGGVLVGSSALLFTPAGSTTAKGTLAGTAPLAFAVSSILRGAGSLASAPTLTFTGSSTLRGAISIAAASSAAFTTGGTVTASARLAGVSPLTFASSATGAVALSQVAGTGSIVFSSAGNVLAFASLAGSGSAAFAAAGAVVLIPAWQPSATPGAVSLTPSGAPALATLTISPTPSATPLAVSPSPAAGTFLQDNDPVQLEWSA